METITSITKKTFSILLLVFTSFYIYGQNLDIVDAFEDYNAAPREVAYVHLNKSTYIEGEMIGFTAYILDKTTKTSSLTTSNLYCTISDKNGKIIKKKLVHVVNGLASNVFNVDDSLSTGIYTFKAYTNWMKNFKESNHYQQTFKVLDADDNAKVKPVDQNNLKLDLQVLGEGGHILSGVQNTLGIIAKNELGYGLPGAKGRIKDDEGTVLSEFSLNHFGLGKIILNPESKINYEVEIDFGDKVASKKIIAEDVGLTVTLSDLGDKVALKLETNSISFPLLKNKIHKIALHNGNEIKITEFVFSDKQHSLVVYPKSELYSGINIFTVFNDKDKPLLERLFFNYDGIKTEKIGEAQAFVKQDSVDVTLSMQNLKQFQNGSLSISVLPSDTKSYNQHNTILSQSFIRPYINGRLEQGGYYFNNVDRKTKYHLDLLMLTQGWSCYDWNTIFTYDDVFAFPFERGIDAVANVNTKKGTGTYIVYPLENSSTQLFEISDNEKVFTSKGLVPTEDDLFRVGYLLDGKNKLNKKPSLYFQFYPSKFPSYDYDSEIVEEEYLKADNSVKTGMALQSWESNETLDEVVITTDAKRTRMEKLANKAINSRVFINSDYRKQSGMRVDIYLQMLGWVTQFDYFSGTLSIVNPRVNWGNNVPLVYLNDALLQDFTLLTFITMSQVDYIEYEHYGTGGGIRGQAGFIKVYTSPDYDGLAKRSNNVVTYDVPLKFATKKTFYTPKYQFYNTSFFREYGTIAWFPELRPNSNGSVTFKIPNTGTKSINLHVEGIMNSDTFISETVNISPE